ncbi:MAG: hypothetical protein BWX98_01625 [Candidatus Aminicenantes bacterium ADurb.Bin147]|nr:MAG: hypothetical protein BWX98_01625 [Candidatus Aminicenantes bacterium ADurb.Bin147]
MSHEQSTIIKDEELILRALAAGTASIEGVGKAIGPTSLVKAVVRVTAVAATPSIVVEIQESDDDSTYATVATFPAITAAGIFEQPFRAAKKYVRYKSTHADADSITYEVLVTTPEI